MEQKANKELRDIMESLKLYSDRKEFLMKLHFR